MVDDVSEWETVDGDHDADHEEDLHTALPNLQHSRSTSQQASLTSRNPYLQGLSRSLARHAVGATGNQPGGGILSVTLGPSGMLQGLCWCLLRAHADIQSHAGAVPAMLQTSAAARSGEMQGAPAGMRCSGRAQCSFCNIRCCTNQPSHGLQRVKQSELAGSDACI